MIILSPQVYNKIGSGLDYAVNAVKPTIGPLGRNIAFDPKMDVPYVINSGREIVKHVNFEDKSVMVGVDVVKQAMEKAFWTAGDGAVATSILVQAMWNEGRRISAAGADSMALMRGIRKASEVAVEALKQQADSVKEDKDIRKLALCAAGGREDIADIVAEVYDNIGPDGYVTVEDSQMAETHITYFTGVKWDKGYSGHFEEQSIILEDPYVLLVNQVVSDFSVLVPALQEARNQGKAILIIAREFKDDVINALHYVRDKAGVDVMGVIAPGYGEVRDLNMRCFSIMFGANVIDDMRISVQGGMSLADCGHVDKAVINKIETVLQGIPNADDPIIVKRRRELQDELLNVKDENEVYRIEQMLTPLAGKTAEIKVGGVMEMEMFERKYLVDNAVHSAYGALKSGYLPGGGKSYILAVKAVEEFAETLQGDEKTGAKILAESLTKPGFQIAENAGYDGKSIAEKMLASESKYEGFNALSGMMEDLYEAGVLDCAKVAQTVITTAVSSVSTAISIAACVVAKDPEAEEMY